MSLRPPRGFHDFIRDRVVPAFKKQRGINQNQFAILLLVSEEEFKDLNSMTFHPSKEPLTNYHEVSMPLERKQYRNYIVARYENIRESSDEVDPIDHHSEEIIVSELDYLWAGYMKFTKGVPPKCFILYSWNFPCTDCTETIISALKQPPYKGINMIVAFSQHWRGETSKNVYRNRKEMRKKGIYFTKVNGVKLNDSESDSDSDDSSEPESDDSDNEDDIDDIEDFDGDHNNLYDVTDNSDEDYSDHDDITNSDECDSDDNSSLCDTNGLYSDDSYDSDDDEDEYD